MTLHEAARRVNGTVNGRWINIRGPGHGAGDRSLGILFDSGAPDGFYVNSLASNDHIECRAHVKSLLQKLDGELCLSNETKDVGREEDLARSARALALWQEAKSPKGTIVEVYLRSRCCSLESVGADAIRFHPNCPFDGLRVPAMLGLITDVVTGEPIGVHRTAVKDNGSDKRFGGDSKKMLGVARRGAIQLYPASQHLGIAEGIESALSAEQVFDVDVWATMSAGGIAAFPILPGIKQLTVFADHDQAGLAAAAACCRRYSAAGIDAEIRRPPQAGTDWNDFWMKENAQCQW